MRYVQLVKISFLCQALAIVFASLLILSTLTLNVGATPPQTGQPNGATKTTRDFRFSWPASPGEATYQLRASLREADLANSQGDMVAWNSAWLQTTEMPFLDMPGAKDGRWYWQVRSQDAAGTIGEWGQVWQVTVDTTGPNISFTKPENTSLHGKASAIELSVSIHDSCADKRCHVKLDGVDITEQLLLTRTDDEAKFVGEITTHTLDDGDHKIVVEATDENGNRAEQTRIFTVDTTAPIVETSIEEGRRVKGVVSLDFSVHDLHRDTYRLTITKDDDDVATGLSVPAESEPGVYRYSWNTTSLTKGVYHLIFTSRDAAGNETVLTRAIEILPPSFELIGVTSDPLLEQLSQQLSRPFVSSQDLDSLLPVVPEVAAIAASNMLSIGPEVTMPLADQGGGGFTLVAPSENGWRIFGILWYWWLCITIITVLMYRRLKVAQVLPA